MSDPFSLSWSFITEAEDPAPTATAGSHDTQTAADDPDVVAATASDPDSYAIYLDGVLVTDFSYELIRGDYRRFPFTVEENGDPLDLTNAIVRAAIKRRHEHTQAQAICHLRSYHSTEVEIVDAGAGSLAVVVEGSYTRDLHIANTDAGEPGTLTLYMDVEITRRGASRSGVAGTIAVTASSGAIVGSGTDFTRYRKGDVLVPSGTGAPNLVACIITEITDATHMTVDYTGWTTQSGFSHDVKIGKPITPIEVTLTLTPDKVR